MRKIIIILILALFIRLLAINQTYYEDEYILNYLTQAHTPHFIETKGGEHPPLGFVLFKLTHLTLGGDSIISRTVPLLFGLLSILLTYYFAKRYWGEKTALFSALLMAFSYHSIYLSLVISIDSICMFLTLLALYYVWMYRDTNKKLLVIGILMGLNLLTKYPSILLFPIILLVLWPKKGFYESLIATIKIGLISLAVFSIFPIYSYFTDWNIFMNTIRWTFTYADVSQNLPFGTSWILLFLWSTPLLLGLTLIYFANIKDNEKYPLGVWIIMGILFYTFLVKRGDYSRYFSTILPALSICSGIVLSKIKWKKNTLIIIGLLTIIFTIIFHAINYATINSIIRPTQDPANYLKLVLNSNFNFFFPYVVDHGSWFGTNFLNIAIIISLFGISALTLIIKKQKFLPLGIMLLLSSGIAYNLFLNNEFLFHLTQPNPDWAVKESIKYIKENNLSLPIYTTNKAIIYYFDEVFGERTATLENNKSIRIDNLELFDNKVKKYGGTILFIDFSTLHKKEKVINHPNCKTKKIFYSKAFPISYILSCQPSQ